MYRPLLCLLLLASPAAIRAAAAPEADYERVTAERGAKIAAALELGDAAKTDRVAAIVARQYRDLRVIHDTRAPDAAARLEQLHGEFLARLATELTPAQIDAVKDGLTYGVAPLTFRVYNEMLPNLTAEQKEKIHAWLLEAREQAMDRGSSEEKHAVFGKYKGKINNYLAAAGIDLKQAEKDLAARRKAASTPATK